MPLLTYIWTVGALEVRTYTPTALLFSSRVVDFGFLSGQMCRIIKCNKTLNKDRKRTNLLGGRDMLVSAGPAGFSREALVLFCSIPLAHATWFARSPPRESYHVTAVADWVRRRSSYPAWRHQQHQRAENNSSSNYQQLTTHIVLTFQMSWDNVRTTAADCFGCGVAALFRIQDLCKSGKNNLGPWTRPTAVKGGNDAYSEDTTVPRNPVRFEHHVVPGQEWERPRR